VQEGFLQDRVVETKDFFKLPYKCPNGEIGSVIVFPQLKEA
jgi:hypothetical protein